MTEEQKWERYLAKHPELARALSRRWIWPSWRGWREYVESTRGRLGLRLLLLPVWLIGHSDWGCQHVAAPWQGYLERRARWACRFGCHYSRVGTSTGPYTAHCDKCGAAMARVT